MNWFGRCGLVWLVLAGLGGPGPAAGDARPGIWVTPDERAGILARIGQETWARERFAAITARADAAVARHRQSRDEFLRGLPWQDGAAVDGHPVLVAGDRRVTAPGDGPIGSVVGRVQRYVAEAVDCGVMYYVTGDTGYAACAADVLWAVGRGLLGVTPADDPINGGWLLQNDHLFEARAIGAQVPLVYDFIAPFLAADGMVWDLGAGREVRYEADRLQAVFRTYARLALERGIINSNWPVLELSSLLHNILALEDPVERAALLELATMVDLPQQDSLRKMLAEFDHAGGVWPESLQYSAGVLHRLIYATALLQRRAPELVLPVDFGRLTHALLRLEDYVFPNGEHARFGDGPRHFRADPLSVEIAYAALGNRPEAADARRSLGGWLQQRIEAGQHDRGRSAGHPRGAESYLDPLAVLWFLPRIEEPVLTVRPLPTTDHLPFAGLVLQRNLSPTGAARDGLMAVVSGGHYVHAHASGMALELFGAGHVLGANAGKGVYTTEEHENYRRLFAAYNTVIVNGASRSQGGWVNLGINQVELVVGEPAIGREPVSPDHSFTLTRFRDDRGEAAEAEQERLVGLVRTGPEHGFYVDVFRSRSDRPDAFHDYLYHNLGDTADLAAGDAALPLRPEPARFRPVAGAVWRRNASFLWPGWQAFAEVAASEPTAVGVTVTFRAADLPGGAAGMRLWVPAGPVVREYPLARAPATKDAPAPYDRGTTPTLILRQRGQAWEEPFAVVYEPLRDGTGSIEAVERLDRADGFAGLRVTTREAGRLLVHKIVILTNETQRWADSAGTVEVNGRYAVVTHDAADRLVAAYLGQGMSLRVGELQVTATGRGTIAAACRVDGHGWWQQLSGEGTRGQAAPKR